METVEIKAGVKTTVNVLMLLTLISLMGFLFFETLVFKILLVSLSLITFILFFINYYKAFNKSDYIVGFYILIMNIYRNYILHNKALPSKHLLWPALGLVLGILLVNQTLESYSTAISYFVAATVIVLVLACKIDTFDTGQFLGVNRIFVPKLLFVLAVLTELTRENNTGKRRGSIIMALVFLLLSYYSESRAGLLVAMFYSLFIIISNWFFLKELLIKKESRTAKILIFLLPVISLILLGVAISCLFLRSRFGSVGFSSSGRTAIYISFFQELTIKKLLFGFRSIQLNTYGHMHNSFIEMVMGNGAISFLPIVLFIIGGFRLMKKSLLLFSFYLLIVLYAAIEGFLFFGVGDLLVIPMLYYAFESKNIEYKDA